jgi:hypothetical protein
MTVFHVWEVGYAISKMYANGKFYFLSVKTSNKKYEYALPVNKNGSFEEIHYWLSVVLPVKISAC